jgi:hypothetical protein
MRTRPIVFVLLFITIWTQVDNFVCAPFLPTPAGWVALDDDEYVPAKRDQSRERAARRQAPQLTRGERAADQPCGGRDSQKPTRLVAAVPPRPSILHTFMSMQC